MNVLAFATRLSASVGRGGLSGLVPKSIISHRSSHAFLGVRCMSALPVSATESDPLSKIRNIGVSAHIDSGKTTLTERVLFYTGRIKDIHEVRGKDKVGAKMDSMELEKEKGITIQSAATYCQWGENTVNIIDTPGHIDFTIEVERALRVLDGAVLVLCGVSGVQSQTMTVDRQMKRYNVPRVVFVNKLDRQGANPWKIVDQLRDKLRLNAAAIQLPIGLEGDLKGVVDLVAQKAYYFSGDKGIDVTEAEVPADLLQQMAEKRKLLLERLGDVDDEMAELFLMEEEPTVEQLMASIRRNTISREFVPVTMGSALANTGVQTMLDALINYLPSPVEVENQALDIVNDEASVVLNSDPSEPFVGLAFKLETKSFGQLTYIRVYQGTLKKGDFMYNMKDNKKVKVPRVVRMHSADMEDVTQVSAGEICAMFGVDCASGDTFTDGRVKYAMTSMHVPDPVLSLSITPKDKSSNVNFSKALNRFGKEDPTFRVTFDPESKQTIISGMGELHLDVYVERIKREYGVECVTGMPQVNYRETITQQADFNYTHKKQSGGSGQFGRVVGYIEPLPEAHPVPFEFENQTIGGSVPPEYIPAVEKGFKEACVKGSLIGHPIVQIRAVVNDGASHAVDSSDQAFKTAALQAIRSCYNQAQPVVMEPVMAVEVSVPTEFQGAVMAVLNKRKGLIVNSEAQMDYCVVEVDVPLGNMFGFSNELRSCTQGKGEFSMEYKQHSTVPRNVQEDLVKEYQKKLAAELEAKK